jgi:hypothetical protein
VTNLWQWLKANDLPNWIALILGLIVPAAASLITFLFQKRRFRYVPGLEVCLEAGEGTIFGERSPLLLFKFVNKSGKTVYLKNPSIRRLTRHLPLHEKTRQDSATGLCELKFRDHHTGYFELRHYVLHTDRESETATYTKEVPKAELIHYRTPFWRRIFSRPRYFVLEYFAVVSTRTYRVKMFF